MIIKTLFLTSLMLASALATGDEPVPIPAALLVQSNFDYSLTRKEFRVHYNGLGFDSANKEVFIKIYNPNGIEAHSYKLKEDEKTEKKAFHFALDDVEAGEYEVEICADSKCSAKTPSLHDVVTSIGNHMLSCEALDSTEVKVTFAEPSDDDWAEESFYEKFSSIINQAQTGAGSQGNYKTEFEKLKMDTNPYYKRTEKIFHTAIKYDLTHYKRFFDTETVNDYCGRRNMLSIHAHIVNEATKKVEHRFKTVNHLSEGGVNLFIRSEKGGKILLETTHKDVNIEDGTYKLLVSLCVTDKDTIESTYCANPISKELKIQEGILINP